MNPRNKTGNKAINTFLRSTIFRSETEVSTGYYDSQPNTVTQNICNSQREQDYEVCHDVIGWPTRLLDIQTKRTPGIIHYLN